MDILLYDGIKIIFRVGLLIMKNLEKELLQLDFEELIVRLKTFDHEEILKDVDQFIRAALKIEVRSAELKEYAKLFKAQGIKIIEHSIGDKRFSQDKTKRRLKS